MAVPTPTGTQAPSLADLVRANRPLRTVLALMLPVGWVTLFLFLPYLLLFVYSVFRIHDTGVVRQVVPAFSLENYAAFLGNLAYVDTLLFSASIAVRVTIFALLLAFPLAYWMAFKVKRHKNLVYMLVIIPLWVSYLVRAVAWRVILGQSGVLNGLLIGLGLIREPLSFLLFSQWSIIIGLTHIYTPFTLMPIYSVLEAIQPSLKEASQDLYANRWQTFLNVVVPLSLPGVLAGSTFAFVLSMGDFIAPQLLGGAENTSQMISNLVATQFGTGDNWPLGAAIGVVILFFVVVLLSLVNKLEEVLYYRGEKVAGERKTDALANLAMESRT